MSPIFLKKKSQKLIGKLYYVSTLGVTCFVVLKLSVLQFRQTVTAKFKFCSSSHFHLGHLSLPVPYLQHS